WGGFGGGGGSGAWRVGLGREGGGGCFAAAPLAQAGRCLAALQEAGYAAAAIVGFVAERSAALEPVTIDLTGERLAAALAGVHPARPRVHALQGVADTERSTL